MCHACVKGTVMGTVFRQWLFLLAELLYRRAATAALTVDVTWW